MKRRQRLEALQVRLPVHVNQARTPELDNLALEAANKLSATPVKRFTFVARRPSGISPIADNLEYRAWGTPKGEYNAVPVYSSP